MIKRLIILGASGNIGEQALEVIKEKKNFDLVAFSVGQRIEIIPKILKDNKKVEAICVQNENDYIKLKSLYKNIIFYHGDKGLISLINNINSDYVLNALVGFVGLIPTLSCIQKGVDIALANKESLVVGGELINKALKKSKSHIYPVDSEHCAIYKCLQLTKKENVKKILITASGGAFRNLKRQELQNVTPILALKHPTWKMGKKVTIDSASMLNKGFEIIEAYYLFNFPISKIEVLMHDESYVHSIIELKSHFYLGEVNTPSMKNPIEYALSDKNHPTFVKKVKKIEEFGPFHFKKFNKKRYPMVAYAIKALKMKGVMPCVLNAVDEVAIDSFLNSKCSFLGIEKIIKKSLESFANIKDPTLNDLLKVNSKAKVWAKKEINRGIY